MMEHNARREHGDGACLQPVSRFASAVFVFVLCSLFFARENAFAQESILRAYQQNFIRSGIAGKAEILRDAATDEQAGVFIGPLYDFALDFVLRNADFLENDPQMINLAVIAARGAGQAGYRGSIDNLWGVFLRYNDLLVREEVLNALGELGRGNGMVCAHLNQYLAEQNRLSRSRQNTDQFAVSACIKTLVKLGDSSSFAPLFGALIADYPTAVRSEAHAALNALPGDYRRFLDDVIRNNTPSEKLAAFLAGTGNRRFSPAEQGRFAETAMEEVLRYNPVSTDEKASIAALGYQAALTLTRLRWSQASDLVVRYFYRIQSEFHYGGIPKERFVEAVNCLGAMGTSEAAESAALLLGLINAQTEKTGLYDEDITLALVIALGTIGDKAAFDHLSYISYLPYTDAVKNAAKESIDHLKW
ncbi:MAG TPA: hypothetical protein DEQ14_12345 [Treponema sp.]|nr:hypothetical protein [Treponema sp.]